MELYFLPISPLRFANTVHHKRHDTRKLRLKVER